MDKWFDTIYGGAIIFLIGCVAGICISSVRHPNPTEPLLTDYRPIAVCEMVLRADNRADDFVTCLANNGLKLVRVK